ncbi:MAG: amino acid transporter [Novosphingobium sp. 28-62-57]|uniref:LysE family translocator n=1 Tax=unclassified Novosphingobium TaxID=2644732 RepID=UPI000BCD3159|nr:MULTISPECIES: LysE family translocator [unclassified Novosphingobium]OYW49813.1 MAG: amino acid transporter [Novosphingobium sp. 12-62-10]OYZ12231.1 MAG: amino acid transporter [Novosphingobium sp. 28-62-57]OZA31776.1 MAG: amino acid transporter [Novosphingobium sp. 17-62-9]HQS68888.1 LysE family translocator [Novosphingobium sp.]
MAFHTWWLFVVTVFFISGSPGPNMLHVMTRSVQLGLGRTLYAMAGCFLAVVSLLSASALGLTALLSALPGAFTVLRVLGAGYLLWLGYKAWTARVEAVEAEAARAAPAISNGQIFRTAFGVGISNPKALLFAAAFLPQFIDASRPELPQFGIMVLTFGITEISWFFIYALGGRSIARALTRPSLQTLFNRVTGGIFVAFGIGMLASRS